MAMNTVNSSAPYNSRLGLKLAGLFVAGFLATVIGGLGLNLLAGLTDGQKSQNDLILQQPAIVIDPKLESELAKVLNYENAQNMADLRDPFQDRSGLSLTEAGRAASVTRPSTGGTNRTVVPAPVKDKNTAGGNGKVTVVPPTVEVAKVDTVTRLLEREKAVAENRPVLPVNEYLAIEDLLPVGAVSGGNGQDELMLYSQAADQIFSFPVGTRFFDGQLSGIGPEGGLFSFYETRETRLKSWVRSIQPRSATNAAAVNPRSN